MSSFVAIIGFLLLAVAFQLFTDYRRAHLVTRFKFEPAGDGGGISVVVELNRSPRNLKPLFDHLSSLAGPIDVIVIVKRSAGRSARNRVRALRVRYPSLSIRTVAYKPRLNKQTIAKRHARQPLIMWLTTDDRLEGDFIRLAQRHFDNPALLAVGVNEHVPVGGTLAQVAHAWRSIRMNVLHLLTRPAAPKAIIYRRKSLYRESNIRADTTWLLRLSHPRAERANGLPYALVSGLLLMPLVLPPVNAAGVVVWTVAGVLVCIQISWVIATPIYRLRDRVLLLLFLPFALIR